MELHATEINTTESTESAEVAILAAVADAVATAAEEGTDAHLLSIYAQADEVEALSAARKLAKVMSSDCPPTRAARLWACAVEGAGLADLRRAADAVKGSGEGEGIEIKTRYGGLSRGTCYGRHADGAWAHKSGSTVTLDRRGKWTVGSSDGFSRRERTDWTVFAVGPYLFAC